MGREEGQVEEIGKKLWMKMKMEVEEEKEEKRGITVGGGRDKGVEIFRTRNKEQVNKKTRRWSK